MTEPGPLARFRRHRGTVRVRTTAAALTVVGAALLVASVLLVVTMSASLEREVEAAVRLRASEVVTALETGTSPADLALQDGDDSFVQVLDSAGEVLASSPQVRGLEALVDLAPGTTAILDGHARENDDTFKVVSLSAGEAGGRFTVLAGRNLDPVEDSRAVVTRILLIGSPLLLAVLGVVTWGVVGRALRSVEAIRAQVSEISPAELNRRVPAPPGNDEIGRLARTMNAMLERLESEDLRRRRFISDASHELRSPLAVIRNQAEVALAHPEEADIEELSTAILEENLRQERLVEEMLLLARIDEQAGPTSTQTIDLDDLVLEEAKRLRDSTSLRVDTTGVSGGRTIGEAKQLRRVVRNLTDNAARHARAAVTFSLFEEDGSVVMVVQDDGEGIAPEHRDSIFERFTRLDDARDRGHGGAGLGLAIVKESISTHGGTITVGEGPAGGARFEVRLPVAP